MKIICDNQEEYEQVRETCRYLHDFSVLISGASKKTKIDIMEYFQGNRERIKPEKGSRRLGFSLDFDKYPFLNFLAHGIHDCSEEIRSKSIEVKK